MSGGSRTCKDNRALNAIITKLLFPLTLGLDDISLPIPIRLHQYIIKDKPGNKSAKPGAINRRPDFSAGGKATKAEPLALLLPLQPPDTIRISSSSPGLLPDIESRNRDDDFPDAWQTNLRVPTGPWRSLSMDHIAPLPSSAGFKADFTCPSRTRTTPALSANTCPCSDTHCLRRTSSAGQ